MAKRRILSLHFLRNLEIEVISVDFYNKKIPGFSSYCCGSKSYKDSNSAIAFARELHVFPSRPDQDVFYIQ